MPLLTELYRPSLALLTDLYQLTMAAGLEAGAARPGGGVPPHLPQRALRRRLHRGRGLAHALELLETLRFEPDDLEYLAGLRGDDGAPLFATASSTTSRGCRSSCDVDAVPEGTVVFPHEPLVRVHGPDHALHSCSRRRCSTSSTSRRWSPPRRRASAWPRGRAGARVRAAAGAGHRRRRSPPRARPTSAAAPRPRTCSPGRLLRHPGARHPRPQLGDALRRRARGLRGLRPRACPTTASSSSTPTTRWRGCATPSRSGAELRARGPRAAASGSTRATSPSCRIEARRMLDEAGLPDARIVATQRPRRAPHREPQAAGRQRSASGAWARGW